MVHTSVDQTATAIDVQLACSVDKEEEAEGLYCESSCNSGEDFQCSRSTIDLTAEFSMEDSLASFVKGEEVGRLCSESGFQRSLSPFHHDCLDLTEERIQAYLREEVHFSAELSTARVLPVKGGDWYSSLFG